MEKSPEAFRTISEVADWLGVPTHVLRFWESRFSQVKPVKRAGGRRYYRPNDMLLLGGIKRLLHDEGMTIRGVQKLLREEGVKHVTGFSQALDSDADMRDVTPEVADDTPSPMAVDVEPETVDNVVPMSPAQPGSPAAPQENVAASPETETPGDEAADAETPVESEVTPQFTFLHRGGAEPPAPAAETGHEKATPQAGPEQESDGQTDLFTSRRAAPPPAEAAPEPPAPAIPATPDVPETDPEDDDRAFPARAGIAAHLRGLPRSRLRVDPALVARAVTELRAIRERL